MDVRRMRPADLDEVIRVWHETCAHTYGFLPTERERTLADRSAYFRANVVPHLDLWIACEGGAVLGLLGVREDLVDRLYVHPTQQRRGVGTALLAKARELSPAGLRAFTHQENAKARAFYEKERFRAVRFGTSPPPESAPDVEYRWP